MNQDTSKQTFWSKARKRFVRFFLYQGSCDSSCSDCAVCPWIDKEKYSFEIKRKEEN